MRKTTRWIERGVSPWRFWDPRSGFIGGVIVSLIIMLLIWCAL